MIPFPNKKYNIILADPPWKYWEGGNKNQSRYYSCMDIEEICKLPTRDIADHDCLLFLWVTFPILNRVFEVITAWGFKYSTCAFVWVKGIRKFNENQLSFLPSDSLYDFMGCGYWTRANVELCLLGKKGSIERKSKNVKQIIYSPIKKHSQKPAETRKRIIELVGDLPRIELFARPPKDRLFEDKSYKGWDLWGDECEN